MSSELERLRAGLEVLERYFCDGCARVVQDKIARLEAAAADPWRDAKTMIEGWRKDILSGRHISPAGENAVHLFDHLTAENARLEKRVAELEAESKAWKEAASVWTVESEMIDTPERLSERICELCGVPHVADMQPPFEGPIVGFEPVLDPSRVLATAETMGWGRVLAVSGVIKPPNARPYRLKGDVDEQA